MRVERNLIQNQHPHNVHVGRLCKRTVGVLSAFAVPIVAMVAVANLPRAEAFGGPGTVALPACLGLCIAGITVSTGGWGAIIGWTACKAACIAVAAAF